MSWCVPQVPTMFCCVPQGATVRHTMVDETTLKLDMVAAGHWDVSVRAVDSFDYASPATAISILKIGRP